MSPDDLERRSNEELERQRSESLRLAKHHRGAQAEAVAQGDKGIATTLGLLATILEQRASLAEAERLERAARHAKWKRAEVNRERAKQERPGRRVPMRQRIVAVLRAGNDQGIAFKVLMSRWEREPVDGLRLRQVADQPDVVYSIDDENDTAGPSQYKRSSLRKMFSERR